MLASRIDALLVPRSVEVFARFLRLGLTSFGGPIAHVGYFRREFVERARWLDDGAFGEILALCSVLPGPTSSQVGIVLGFGRAGTLGAFAAWLGFTLPSALAMTIFGLWLRDQTRGDGTFASGRVLAGITEGLLAAAAGVVALAVVQLARTFAATTAMRAIALVALALALGLERLTPSLQWLPLLLGGAAGYVWLPPGTMPRGATALALPKRAAAIAATLFVVMLFALPIVAPAGSALALFARCFRAGALVFGGGHVVLPFLQGAIGPIVSERTFFAGYGAAQAMPGPLSTFAAFLGAASRVEPGGWVGAAIALAGIFAPSFLLLIVVVPLWRGVRELPRASAVLAGVGASVVGLLAAVFVNPIAVSLLHDRLGGVLAVAAFGVLCWTRAPAWAVVIGCASAGGALAAAG